MMLLSLLRDPLCGRGLWVGGREDRDCSCLGEGQPLLHVTVLGPWVPAVRGTSIQLHSCSVVYCETW